MLFDYSYLLVFTDEDLNNNLNPPLQTKTIILINNLTSVLKYDTRLLIKVPLGFDNG